MELIDCIFFLNQLGETMHIRQKKNEDYLQKLLDALQFKIKGKVKHLKNGTQESAINISQTIGLLHQLKKTGILSESLYQNCMSYIHE